MRILTDSVLEELLQQQRPLITGIERPARWNSKDSPVQPSSIDLHIGAIHVPGKTMTRKNEGSSVARHTLNAGGTAIVETKERIDFDNGHMAIGFLPDSLASLGILTTNPGHIDPGYKGPLHFTVINMGKKPYELRLNDIIATLVIFELDSPAAAGWSERNEPVRSSVQSNLDRLSEDYMDIEHRTKKLIDNKFLKAGIFVALIPLIGIVVSLLFQIFSLQPRLEKNVSSLENRVTVLEEKNSLPALEKRIEVLENRTSTQNQASDSKKRVVGGK